jgi:hypothetical protein
MISQRIFQIFVRSFKFSMATLMDLKKHVIFICSTLTPMYTNLSCVCVQRNTRVIILHYFTAVTSSRHKMCLAVISHLSFYEGPTGYVFRFTTTFCSNVLYTSDIHIIQAPYRESLLRTNSFHVLKLLRWNYPIISIRSFVFLCSVPLEEV